MAVGSAGKGEIGLCHSVTEAGLALPTPLRGELRLVALVLGETLLGLWGSPAVFGLVWKLLRCPRQAQQKQ